MSWQPAIDPKPGEAFACDAIDIVIVPRARDLGGFSVRRALPSTQRQMVGPFIFFDQMGPAEFLLGAGMDVRPHPHIGLSTVTYLFDGTIIHRDSRGMVLPIRPGELNWMTAGRGIAHSERTPPELRSVRNYSVSRAGSPSPRPMKRPNLISLTMRPTLSRCWRTRGKLYGLSPDQCSESPRP